MRGDREAFGMFVNATSDRLFAIGTGILRDTSGKCGAKSSVRPRP